MIYNLLVLPLLRVEVRVDNDGVEGESHGSHVGDPDAVVLDDVVDRTFRRHLSDLLLLRLG